MSLLFDVGMAIGPVLGYIHQYRLISSKQSVGTFSIDICAILLFANILRLNFYLFQKYETALFFQSVIMVTAQVCLVHVCTKYSKKKIQVTFSERPTSESQRPEYEEGNIKGRQTFWRWRQFSSYVKCISYFVLGTFGVSLLFLTLAPQFKAYGILIGLVALLSEVAVEQQQSVLILPQILKNYRDQSTKGLSYVLVNFNLSGDIIKLVYFIIKEQAFQFIMCGVIQVCLDSFVVMQIVYYRFCWKTDSAGEKQSLKIIEQKEKIGMFKASKDKLGINHPDTEDNFDDFEVQIQMQPPVQELNSPTEEKLTEIYESKLKKQEQQLSSKRANSGSKEKSEEFDKENRTMVHQPGYLPFKQKLSLSTVEHNSKGRRYESLIEEQDFVSKGRNSLPGSTGDIGNKDILELKKNISDKIIGQKKQQKKTDNDFPIVDSERVLEAEATVDEEENLQN